MSTRLKWKLTQAVWLVWFAVVTGLIVWLHNTGASNLELLVMVPIGGGLAFVALWVQKGIGAPPGGGR